MATTENPDFASMIELDTFVSPNAATDVAPSDERDLELDTPPAAMSPAAFVESYGTPVAIASESPLTVTSAMSDLASDLAAMAAESAHNAASSAARFGSIRTVDANNAPTVTADLPVGAGVVVDNRVNGQTPVFNRATRAAITPTPTPNPEIVILPAVQAAVTTDDEKMCGIELAWNPASRDGHEIPRTLVCAVLDQHGLSAYHPPIPMPKGLFGTVFKQLNGSESRDDRDDETRLMARCVTRNDYERLGWTWPEDLVSRYIVGTIDASMDLGSLGSKDLVCSLVKVDGGFECQFTGGTPTMRNAITARFDALQGASMLNVTSLLKWYTDVLARKLGAIRDGFAMLIVDNGTDLAKSRIETAEKLANALQGSDLYGPSPVMGRRLKINRVVSRGGVTQNQFHMAVGAGLLEAVREHGKVFAKELAAAVDAARTAEANKIEHTPASIDLAGRRAMIGSDRANSRAIGLLATLRALSARAVAMVDAIGEHARPAIAACEALRMEYAPKCKGIDSTSAMMAEIELD